MYPPPPLVCSWRWPQTSTEMDYPLRYQSMIIILLIIIIYFSPLFFIFSAIQNTRFKRAKEQQPPISTHQTISSSLPISLKQINPLKDLFSLWKSPSLGISSAPSLWMSPQWSGACSNQQLFTSLSLSLCRLITVKLSWEYRNTHTSSRSERLRLHILNPSLCRCKCNATHPPTTTVLRSPHRQNNKQTPLCCLFVWFRGQFDAMLPSLPSSEEEITHSTNDTFLIESRVHNLRNISWATAEEE